MKAKPQQSVPLHEGHQQHPATHSSPQDNVLSVDTIAEILAPVFQRHGIRRAILFGSRARDDASRKSDIDLILVQDTDRFFLDRLDGILLELNSLFAGVSVEALIYTPLELKRMASKPFIAKALREGIVIHEQVGTTAHG